MKHACVEGPSFAGKSTLSRSLAYHYGGIYVGEYREYAYHAGRRGYPPQPTTTAEAEAFIDFFMDLERERSAHIRSTIEAGRNVYSDRSILSLAAYQVALARQQVVLPNAPKAAPDYALEAIVQAIQQGDVALPERVILLRVANRAVHEGRVLRRGQTPMAECNLWAFSQAVTAATEDMSELLLPADTPVRSIVSYEDDLSHTLRDSFNFLEAPLGHLPQLYNGEWLL